MRERLPRAGAEKLVCGEAAFYRRAMRLWPALMLLIGATAARANSIREEAVVSTVQATAANPRSGSFTDSLSGTVDLSSAWTLNLGGSLTLQGRTPALDRGQFPESGSMVTLFTGGADWNASESLTLGGDLHLSPRSTQYAGTSVTLRQANGTETTADALVRSQTSQTGGSLSVTYDPAGDSALEWSYGASVEYSHYDVDQNIPRVRLADGTTVTSTTLRQETTAYCQAHPDIRNCGQALLSALRATPVSLDSERLSGNLTATVLVDTDITLSGDYYVYQQDPGQIPFFTLAAAGRTAGVPIAPLKFEVRPEVVHRFGDFSAKLWVQAGEYVKGTGESTAAAGLKLQYKFTKAFRSWLAFSGQRDVDQSGEITRSASVTAGAAYRWLVTTVVHGGNAAHLARR